VFVIGVLMIVLALGMGAAGVAGPEAARAGLIGGAIGVGLSGVLLTYLDAPSRRDKPAAGMQRAKATILEAGGTAGSVSGYQMIELTLEVKPKDGLPFQVKRKVSAGKLGLGRIEAGRKVDVVYDPANPQRVELA
jgi:hypothetical protein